MQHHEFFKPLHPYIGKLMDAQDCFLGVFRERGFKMQRFGVGVPLGDGSVIDL